MVMAARAARSRRCDQLRAHGNDRGLWFEAAAGSQAHPAAGTDCGVCSVNRAIQITWWLEQIEAIRYAVAQARPDAHHHRCVPAGRAATGRILPAATPEIPMRNLLPRTWRQITLMLGKSTLNSCARPWTKRLLTALSDVPALAVWRCM